MAQDLKSMSRKQLEKHLKDVKKALAMIEARELKEARKAAEKAVAEFGYSLTDITGEAKPEPKARKKSAKSTGPKSEPRFANPDDAKQTWTGKGRQPNWYRAQIEKGTPPTAMQI